MSDPSLGERIMAWLIPLTIAFVPICCCLTFCVLGRSGGISGGGEIGRGWRSCFDRIFCGICGCAGDAADEVVRGTEEAVKDASAAADVGNARPSRRSGDRGGNACQEGCMWAITCGYCCSAVPRTPRWQERVARPLDLPGQVAQPAVAPAAAPAAGGGGGPRFGLEDDDVENSATLPLLPLRARVVVATPVAASYAAHRV